jgi:hypothetical protein
MHFICDVTHSLTKDNAIQETVEVVDLTRPSQCLFELIIFDNVFGIAYVFHSRF